MAKLIASIPADKSISSKQDIFYTFSKIIIGQQISVHAANAIFTRFAAVLDHQLSAEKFLSTTPDKILATGFSKSKVRYLGNIAHLLCESSFFAEYKALKSSTVKEKKLLGIVGVGKWSSDMFMIFHDLEPDILPLGDVGLINAIKKHYAVYEPEAYKKIAQKWHPYASVATWYLWATIDDEIVQY
eukprot:COSAG01_NODE_6_length_54687_cov_500.907599_37_plen_186_part_00